MPDITLVADPGETTAELVVDEATLPVEFHPESFGGYTVRIPSIPSFSCYGETLEETQDKLHEALKAFLEGMHARGEPLVIYGPFRLTEPAPAPSSMAGGPMLSMDEIRERMRRLLPERLAEIRRKRDALEQEKGLEAFKRSLE